MFACFNAWGQEPTLLLPDLSRRVFSNGKGEADKLASPRGNPLGIEFDKIKIERSLLLRNCQTPDWCLDEGFSFESVLGLAAATMGASKIDLAKNWKNQIPYPITDGEDLNVLSPLRQIWNDKAPLRHLALVNRLDLARWNPSITRWEGAEIRFVFGGNAPDAWSALANLTVIIEFRYRPLTWSELKALAQVWRSFADVESDQLKNVLRDSIDKKLQMGQMSLIRLRTNSELETTGNWQFLQWELQQDGWVRTVLDQELKHRCIHQPCKDLISIWDYLEANPSLTEFSIDRRSNALQGKRQEYFKGYPVMPLLKGYANLEPRNLLSLQQCTGCHLSETKNEKFMHIENTDPSSTKPMAEISPFLSGANLYASFRDLLSEPPKGLFTFEREVPCQDPASLVCGSNQNVAKRAFHDLGRRRLFLAALLTSSENYSESDLKLLKRFTTLFSH